MKHRIRWENKNFDDIGTLRKPNNMQIYGDHGKLTMGQPLGGCSFGERK